MRIKPTNNIEIKDEIEITSHIDNEKLYDLVYPTRKGLESAISSLKNGKRYGYGDTLEKCKETKKYINEDRLIEAVILETGLTKNFIKSQISKVKSFIDRLDELKKPSYDYKAKGIVLINIPSNETIESFFNSVLPALIAGNNLIIKPSKEKALSTYYLFQSIIRAGISNDRMIFCPLKKKHISFLIEEKLLDGVYWTGGSKSTYAVGSKCLKHGIRFIYDSEGNDWAYIDKKSNLDLAISSLIESVICNNGLSCNAIEGVFIHDEIYDQVIRKLLEKMNEIKIGDPRNEKTSLGILEEDIIKNLREQIRNSKYENIHTIFNVRDFPKLIENPTKKSTIVREESYGPLLWVKRTNSIKDVFEYLKENDYGISFTIFSKDKTKINHMIKNISVSRFNVNKNPLEVDMLNPWGGIKKSGSGVEDWFEKFIDRIYIND